MGLERQVRKEPMVTNRNGKSARAEHQKEKQDLEPINPEEIKIGRDCSQRENQRADEKRAGWPINFFERNLRKHGVGRCLGAEGGTTGKLRGVRILFASEAAYGVMSKKWHCQCRAVRASRAILLLMGYDCL